MYSSLCCDVTSADYEINFRMMESSRFQLKFCAKICIMAGNLNIANNQVNTRFCVINSKIIINLLKR
jgi:hypothetical protein